MIEARTRLGPYEVLSPLGAGGVEEVWKARDTRLDRTVAIKILPPHLSSSPVRGDESFEAGAPRPAFESWVKVSGYDVAPDGQRFLKGTPVVDSAHLPQRLLVYWPAFIKR